MTTEVMAYNVAHAEIKTLDGAVLNLTEDFKYLGSHIGSSEKDIQTRKALAWRALHSMKKVWRLSMHAELKKKLFVTTVEATLLYGCETWTLSARDESRLDGCYTRMLRMAMNITCMDKTTNEDLYGNLPRISNKIREKRFRLARHCVRHSELEVSNLVLWEPTQGKFNRESQRLTYVDKLRKDTGLQTTAELKTLMKDKCEWRAIAQEDST